MILPKAPPDIHDCAVFRHLASRSSPSDGLLDRIETFVRHVSPQLDLVIAGPFSFYTLHNPAHARKLVHLAGEIISSGTLAQLSPLELALIVCAAFLHDLGMSLSSVERARIIESPDFADTLQQWPEIGRRLAAARTSLATPHCERRELLELEVFQLQEAALSHHLRARHTTRARYEELVARIKRQVGRTDLFQVSDVSFEDVLIDICESHGLDTGVLAEVSGPYEARFPRDLVLGDQPLNTQFCAAVLRLTDILDFDRERTPRVLFESLGIEDNDLPGSRTTLLEWQKHMAVYATEFSDHELVFSAESHHPAVEAAIIEFGKLIERELRDTLFVLRNNPAQVTEKYALQLPSAVRTRIRSQGYTFHDIRMRLDGTAITNLLMGERLYSQPAAALRELIQNAVDACQFRVRLSGTTPAPAVSVTLQQGVGEAKWIEVVDNGIGMDEHVISQYLFQVGRCYYDSPECQRLIAGHPGDRFVPISRFGVGIASVFMLGDLLEITTCNPLSPRGDKRLRHLRIDGRGGLAFVTEQPTGAQGTQVRVRLRERYHDRDSIQQTEAYIRDTVLRPNVPVVLNLLTPFTITRDNFYVLSDAAADVARRRSVEFVALDLAQYSDSLQGMVVFSFGTENGRLGLASRSGLIEEHYGINPVEVFRQYRGNRLTVNGFRMGISKTHRVFGSGLRFVYDIDILADGDVQFDVSRDRISPHQAANVRSKVRDAIVLGLQESGVFSRMTDQTRHRLTATLMHGEDARKVTEELLKLVEKLTPAETWPIGLHRQIAERLGISQGLARTALSVLLETGRVFDGRRKIRD
jgi:molecular chaperone HtpG